jgi:hypothetical protein
VVQELRSFEIEEGLQASIYINEKSLLGGNRVGEIPDTIPNSEVKPYIADGTAHKSVGE